MSILVTNTSPDQILVTITRSEFKKFRNGASLDTVQELAGDIKTQVELLDFARQDGKVVKVRGYKNKPVDSWGPDQLVRFIKDKHKEAFGTTIEYIAQNRGRTMAALAGLMGRFNSLDYSKQELVLYIEWCFNESESTEMSFSHICTNRFLREWEKLAINKKKKRQLKGPYVSKAFKRKMLKI